jgi:hypothetical protein
MHKVLLIAVLVLFSALTAYAAVHAGGVLEMVMIHLHHPEGWQIFTDLVIVMCLLLVFMYRDAKVTGRPFWPWAVFSLASGSFGPLLYFITAKQKNEQR